MKKDALFIILLGLASALVFIYICLPQNQVEIAAVDGVLDLRGVSLGSTTFRLTGEWLVSFNNGEQSAVRFPHAQSLFDRFGYGVGDTSFCTLTVLTDADVPFDMFVPEIDDSCEIRVNGETIFTTDKVQIVYVDFKPQNGVSVIEVISTKHIDAKNGMRNSVPKISVSPHLRDAGLRQQLAVALILGGFLMIGVYHLLLYRFSPKDKVYLVFALMCVFEVAQMLFEYNGIVTWVCPLRIGVFYRVYLLMVCLHGICMCIFTSLVFNLHYNKTEVGFIALMFATTILSVLIFPVTIAIRTILGGYPPMLLYVFKIFRAKDYWDSRPQILYLASLLMFMFSGIVKLRVEEPYNIFMFPLVCGLFMILSQCYLLSRNYMNALLDTARINRNLESLVEQRTRELAQINETLTVSQNALKDMISNISHDLKTPLTVLGQYLELLDDGSIDLDVHERSDYIHVAYSKNLNMQRLIRNLFEATRIETGQAVYKMESQPLTELLLDIEDRHGKYLRELGLHFATQSNRECDVKLDRDKIWSVFDNLIYNAARHTPSGGSISVNAWYEDGKCRIEVADSGEGIAKEHLPHIFERYYKVSKARNEGGGDSGIGLYIVKTAVQGMGGFVSVQSCVGKGTSFFLTLDAYVDI